MTQDRFRGLELMEPEDQAVAVAAGLFKTSEPAQPIPAAAEPANDQPFDNALAIRLEFHTFGTARKGDLAEITTGAEKQLLRLGKAIIVSAALEAIKKGDRDLRAWVMARSTEAPLFKSGTRLVKLTMFEPVDAKVLEYLTVTRPALVEAFIADWPRAIDDAAKRLGPQYRAKNYPDVDEVRACFTARRNWVEIGAPKALEKFNADAYQRTAVELRETFRESMLIARAAVQERLREMTARLAERLSGTGKDGKRKVFKDSSVENIQEFFDLFDACDLTNDTATRAIVDRGRALVAGLDPQELRDATDQDRANIARQFEAMTKDLEALIVAAPSRAYGEDY